MTEYLVDLITPPPGTVCQSDQQPFDPEFARYASRRVLQRGVTQDSLAT